MKKLIGALTTIMLLVWGAGNIQAQDWTWQAPVLVHLEDGTSLVLDEIAADPTTGTLYGIADDGNVYKIVQSEGLAARLTTGENDGANDIAIGPHGEVYICTNTSIQVYDTSVGDFVNLVEQPETDPLEGNFIRITVGMMGMLHVLFQPSEDPVVHQYLLNGTLPVITEGVSISFKPRTLNLKSRGKWVSCHIGLPDGYAVGGIDRRSVQITHISIEGVAQAYVGPIGVPDDAPWEVEEGKLKVKFIRFDVITAIRSLLSGNEGKFVKVTLTVHGKVKVNEQYFDFEGTDTIKVKTGQKKK